MIGKEKIMGSSLNKSETPKEVKTELWTERMKEALVKGLKGGRWYSLIDKIDRESTLIAAYEEVKSKRGSAGVDGMSIENFTKKKEEHLKEIRRQLGVKDFKAQAVRRVYIPKGNGRRRPLGIPTIRDRIIQTAIKMVIEPIFEHDFHEMSFGFRPGKSTKDALRRVEKLLKVGNLYVVDADLKNFFDVLDHGILMQKVEMKIADGKVLDMLRKYLKQEIREETGEIIKPEAGVPQGGVISPLLANIYLDEMDHRAEVGGYEMTRYADDIVIQCKSQEEAEKALLWIRNWVGKLGISLNEEKTKIVNMNEVGSSFEFLGYRFKKAKSGKILRLVKKKSLSKFKDKIRELTPRTSGKSLEMTIAKLNPILRGWFEYFKHTYYTELTRLDEWTRMRLRSILRKRSKRKGRARGSDHIRWKNQFFRDNKLFTLMDAKNDILANSFSPQGGY